MGNVGSSPRVGAWAQLIQIRAEVVAECSWIVECLVTISDDDLALLAEST